MTHTHLTESEFELLKDNALAQQQRLREKLQAVDATTLTQEELTDYTFCVNKNFLAIRNIRQADFAVIVERMRQNEDEISGGISNLETLIDQIRSQADLLGVLDRVISIVVRVVSIFAPVTT